MFFYQMSLPQPASSQNSTKMKNHSSLIHSIQHIAYPSTQHTQHIVYPSTQHTQNIAYPSTQHTQHIVYPSTEHTRLTVPVYSITVCISSHMVYHILTAPAQNIHYPSKQHTTYSLSQHSITTASHTYHMLNVPAQHILPHKLIPPHPQNSKSISVAKHTQLLEHISPRITHIQHSIAYRISIHS